MGATTRPSWGGVGVRGLVTPSEPNFLPSQLGLVQHDKDWEGAVSIEWVLAERVTF